MGETVEIPKYVLAGFMLLLGWALNEAWTGLKERLKEAKADKISKGELPDRRHDTCVLHTYFEDGLRDLKAEVKSGFDKLFDLHRIHAEAHLKELQDNGRREG
jgi:hypothetical protein